MTKPLSTADHSAVITYLAAARKTRSQATVAAHFGISIRTLRRWETGELQPPAHIAAELQRILNFGPLPRKGDFTFIDLFAGIGGIRLAFEGIGGECVFIKDLQNLHLVS